MNKTMTGKQWKDEIFRKCHLTTFGIYLGQNEYAWNYEVENNVSCFKTYLNLCYKLVWIKNSQILQKLTNN